MKAQLVATRESCCENPMRTFEMASPSGVILALRGFVIAGKAARERGIATASARPPHRRAMAAHRSTGCSARLISKDGLP